MISEGEGVRALDTSVCVLVMLYIQCWDEHVQLMGEHACQTPCRELLIPLRGPGGPELTGPSSSSSKSSADRHQPTSGGCCPSAEDMEINEEHALTTKIRKQLFFSKCCFLKKIKNILYG